MTDDSVAQQRRLVQNYQEAKKCSPDEIVLIEVPGKFARPVIWLVNMLNNPDKSEAGVLVRQLLSSKGAKPE